MADIDEEWRPGSFTKNFGWGSESQGLSRLHKAIRIGFQDVASKVPRDVFSERLEAKGINHYVALNFFLFNVVENGESYVLADELAFQAINFPHDLDFDRLALFSFNLSLVGRWKGARHYQSRPALWSNRYIVERLGGVHRWNTSKVNADDIDVYLSNDRRYTGKTTRKLSTNLNYLYELGGLQEIYSSAIDRWWMNAAFLAADRLCMSGLNRRISVESLIEAFIEFDFAELTGGYSRERDYALSRVLEMYVSAGGPNRFEVSVTEIEKGSVNDPRPVGLVDKRLPRAVKALPAGVINPMAWEDRSYQSLDYEELSDFDVDRYVRDFTIAGINRLNQRSQKPNISARELMDIMRG